MIKNYLFVALRNIFRQKGFSIINISGLSIGLACTLLILLWVQDELSFDKFHPNASMLYRVEEDQYYSGEVYQYHVNVTPYVSGPVWREKIPEIEEATRYAGTGGLLFRYEENSLDYLKKTWGKIMPGYPFDYSFLDEDFDSMYRTEERMGALLKYFAIIAIFIACLGLFGLASFTAEQRTKEIGIRKTMGATVSRIVILLSTEFSVLVIISIFIASPVAWYFMRQWLQDYAYSTFLSWRVFALAAVLALLIALFTVSFQAIKAALTNPADALKYE